MDAQATTVHPKPPQMEDRTFTSRLDFFRYIRDELELPFCNSSVSCKLLKARGDKLLPDGRLTSWYRCNLKGCPFTARSTIGIPSSPVYQMSVSVHHDHTNVTYTRPRRGRISAAAAELIRLEVETKQSKQILAEQLQKVGEDDWCHRPTSRTVRRLSRGVRLAQEAGLLEGALADPVIPTVGPIPEIPEMVPPPPLPEKGST